MLKAESLALMVGPYMLMATIPYTHTNKTTADDMHFVISFQKSRSNWGQRGLFSFFVDGIQCLR